MIFKLRGLEEDMTGQRSKPRGPRLFTVTGSQISPGVPCHLQPSSKPRRQTETVNQQSDIACALVILLGQGVRRAKEKTNTTDKFSLLKATVNLGHLRYESLLLISLYFGCMTRDFHKSFHLSGLQTNSVPILHFKLILQYCKDLYSLKERSTSSVTVSKAT